MLTRGGSLAAGLVMAGVALTLVGCSTGTDDGEPDASEAPEASAAASADTAADPAAGLVGTGCDAYVAAVPNGAGSLEGMALAPVVVAANDNPLLTRFTDAVSGQLNPAVDLVDTLNGDQLTIFAPVDDAFAALDPATIATLQTPEGAETLTSLLRYHVVAGQIAPADIVGEQTTVQGGTVIVEGLGDSLTVDGANVICGGVQTANATVYLIDQVMTPTMG